MQNTFTAAINQICDEKNIDKEVVLEAIEASLIAAYRKDYGNEFQKLQAKFEENTGLIKIFQIKDVVEEVENDEYEILLADAKKYRKNIKVGDKIKSDVTPKDGDEDKFGRIAAQTAKQVIIQRLQEAEREAIFNRYKDRVGEIINARVQRVETNNIVYLELENTTTVTIEPSEQIPGEKYFNGQMLKVYIAEVKKTTKGPTIIVSRSHPKFIEGLLVFEVPEIKEGNVLIKSIAREAGIRTKITVQAIQEGVDPVGSCVGQRGVRIQNVTNEIADEKIDVIEYSEDMVTMIVNTLAPAKIMTIQLDQERKRAKVFVMTDQRSLAIGKNGQNVRLASKLVGWEIDILDFIDGETAGLKVSKSSKKQIEENNEAADKE
jgi:transcription termination/antitermination protein NusA